MSPLRHRARVVAALAALVLGGLAPSASGEFLLGPGCSTFAVSPEFARDGTAACAGVIVVYDANGFPDVVGVTVGITVDAGRTWLQAPGAGVAATWFDAVQGLTFSPNYVADRTLYLQTTDGLYSSVSLGAAWTLVSPAPRGMLDDIVAWDSSGVAQVALLSAERSDEVVLAAPPAPAPAVGSTDDDRRLVVIPGASPVRLMFAESAPQGDDNTTRRRVTVRSCDARLTCVPVLHSWPVGTGIHAAGVLGDGRTAYAVVRSARAGGPLSFWASVDGGVTWRAWSGVDRAYATVRHREGWSDVGIAAHPAYPRRVFMRILTADAPAQREVVLRSDNGGATWQRVFDSSRTRTPWLIPTGARADDGAHLVLTGSGRLFLLATSLDRKAAGAVSNFVGRPYCSSDGGRTWLPSCR